MWMQYRLWKRALLYRPLHSEIILALSDITFEARLWNRSQSVNFSSRFKICLVLTWSRMWNIIGKWSESRVSERITSESLIFLCTTISSASSPFPTREQWVWHCGAEISKSLVPNNCNSFWPEGLETALFQDECLAFRSPTKMNLCLKLKSSVMSTTF
jgi:hypothetical protein